MTITIVFKSLQMCQVVGYSVPCSVQEEDKEVGALNGSCTLDG